MIHPTEVRGKFKNWRIIVRAILISFILVLPWIRIHGHQALLLDIVHRKFSIFGNLFFAQDVPLLFLLVINFALSIALVTAFFGRVWCGWLCPQTIFIEGVFRVIESWTEGKAETRRKNDKLPLNFERAMRKSATWVLFALSTLWVTHSVLAIFIGSDQLIKIIQGPFSENPTSLVFILISNFVLLFDFGFLRENFCLVACPYGKFQSVLQDRYTVTVAYDPGRGEPRRGTVPDGAKAGECVNCSRCVTVCPTGIDIRDGAQLDCIGCTACMDACGDVSNRMGKEKSLIGYYSEVQLLKQKQKWIRPRILIYCALISIFGGVAIYQIVNIKPYEIMFYKVKGEPFKVVHPTPSEEKITNLFNAELSNKTGDPIQVTFRVVNASGVQLIMPNNPLTLEAGKVQSNPFTIEFDRGFLKLGSANSEVAVDVKDLVTGQTWSTIEKLHVIGPF